MVEHIRLGIEIPELQQFYKKIEVTYEHKNPIHIILYDPLTKTLPKKIQLTIPKDYPFKAPIISINNIPYLQTIEHIDLEIMRREIKKPFVFLGNCLHCNFITKDNWSPAACIKHIFSEIEKVEEFKQIFQEHTILKKIGIKYNIPKEITDWIHSYT
jgi:hypothetical protein